MDKKQKMNIPAGRPLLIVWRPENISGEFFTVYWIDSYSHELEHEIQFISDSIFRMDWSTQC